MTEAFLLAFGAHPDDVELGAGGTCALHAKDGVVICDLTQAELSSNGDPVSRRAEALAAAKVLGVAERICLDIPDRGLTVTSELVAKVARAIRTYRPRIVLAPHRSDRHPDHGRCAELVYEAVFTAGLRRVEDGLPPHRPAALYHYMINGMESALFAIDVATVYEQKRAALRQYRSQFAPTEGVSTPLTQNSFLPMVEGRDRLFGQQVGCAFAEGFWRREPLAMMSLRQTLSGR